MCNNSSIQSSALSTQASAEAVNMAGARVGTVPTGCAPRIPHLKTICQKKTAAAEEKLILEEAAGEEEN